MAVVVIVGILATLAAVGYRQYVNSAKSSEAVWMVNGIRAAQEAYRAETLSYLDVSTTLTNYYPAGTPSSQKVGWGGGTDDTAKRWRILNVATDGAVYYRYAVVAGPPGAIDGSAIGVDSEFTVTFPTAVEPWYVVQATGDINGDGDFSLYLATSFSNDVFWVNEGQ